MSEFRLKIGIISKKMSIAKNDLIFTTKQRITKLRLQIQTSITT